MGSDETELAWWGRFQVPVGQHRHFRIGPCGLWFERDALEWRVTRDPGADPLDRTVRVAVADVPVPDRPAVARELDVHRFATSSDDTRLVLQPRLADRPVVVQAAQPFSLLGGDTATLYVSTALWVSATTGEPPRAMLDVPSFRPSDTWFGRSTREGQLCYASRTSARLRLEEISPLPARCVTPLRLRNRAGSALLLERVSIPVPYLSVFASPASVLFTEAIELVREQDGTVTGVSILDGPPAEAGAAVQLSEPRDGQERNLLAKAFSALVN